MLKKIELYLSSTINLFLNSVNHKVDAISQELRNLYPLINVYLTNKQVYHLKKHKMYQGHTELNTTQSYLHRNLKKKKKQLSCLISLEQVMRIKHIKNYFFENKFQFIYVVFIKQTLSKTDKFRLLTTLYYVSNYYLSI